MSNLTNKIKRRGRSDVLRGTPLHVSVKQLSQYKIALRKLVNEMVRETNEVIRRIFTGENAEEYINEREELAASDESVTSTAKRLLDRLTRKFEMLFSKRSKELVKNMLTDTSIDSQRKLNASIKELSGGVALTVSVVPKGLETATQAMVANNVSLIKSIPDKYFTDITTVIMQAITKGSGLAEILPFVRNVSEVSDRRVKNLALDQVRKTFNGINQIRMQAVGIKKFRWLHSGGSQHPRKDHVAMNGNIYSFDDLPIIDRKTGERGIPGQAINCRCTMTPVIEFD